jgi:hypothetical protein
MEFEETVKARRRQEFPLYDVKTRPYSLRANLFIEEKLQSHINALD